MGKPVKLGRFTYATLQELIAFVLVVLAISVPAHGRNLALTRNIDGYTLDIAINQNPPIVGRNDLRVEIKDQAGKNVAGVAVTVNYFMPPMPSMPPMNYTIKALPAGPGYGATMDLIMKGPWNIVIRAGVGAKQLRMTVLIDVR